MSGIDALVVLIIAAGIVAPIGGIAVLVRSRTPRRTVDLDQIIREAPYHALPDALRPKK